MARSLPGTGIEREIDRGNWELGNSDEFVCFFSPPIACRPGNAPHTNLRRSCLENIASLGMPSLSATSLCALPIAGLVFTICIVTTPLAAKAS